MGFADGKVIAGGHFANIALAHIPKLAAFSTSGEIDTTWVRWPNSIKGVWAIVSTPTALDVGGVFTVLNGEPATRFTELAVGP